MDSTLRAILSELMACSVELERLRQRVLELEAKDSADGSAIHAD